MVSSLNSSHLGTPKMLKGHRVSLGYCLTPVITLLPTLARLTLLLLPLYPHWLMKNPEPYFLQIFAEVAPLLHGLFDHYSSIVRDFPPQYWAKTPPFQLIFSVISKV